MLIIKILIGIRNSIFLIIGLLIVTLSILELIFSPMLALKYYSPSLYRQGFTDIAITFFCIVCILIQVCNFLAALSIFVSVFLTGYHERWIAYDTMTLLSVSLSLTMITHQSLTGVNFYQTNIERDIYIQVSSIGDIRCTRKMCFNTDVYNWHQNNQCCGWHSASDLIGTVTRNQSSDRLPQFCCLQSSPIQTKPCTLNSINRFSETCYHRRVSFMMLRSVSFISHPCSLWYSVLKTIIALSFTFAKQHSLLPQAEGLYSYYIPP